MPRLLFLAILLLTITTFTRTATAAAPKKPAVEESIEVSVVGTLHTGIMAIGGETTGTTITAKGVTWELDFGKQTDLRALANSLDKQKAAVKGTLERRAGVEVHDRWIVHVTSLRKTAP